LDAYKVKILAGFVSKIHQPGLNPDYAPRNLIMSKAKVKIMRKSYVDTMRK